MKQSVTRLALVAVVALSGFAGAACRGPEPTSPAGGVEAPYDPPKLTTVKPGQEATVEVAMYNMYYGDSVRHFCAGPDPFFSFDSSKADTAASPTLKVLADCMKTGPLVGKSITLTGRTDPRGTDDYNAKLGLQRAERVKRYLVANGVDASRIQTGSLGKTDAAPDPKDWPADRRVEIELSNP